MKIAYKLLLPIGASVVLGFTALSTLSIQTERTMIDAFERKASAVILEQFAQQREQRLAAERDYLEFVVRMAAEVAVEFVSNMNYSGIEQPICELLLLKGVEAVEVFDATTGEVFITAYRDAGETVVSRALPEGFAHLRQLQHPLTGVFDGRSVDYGSITLYYNDAHLLDEIAAMEQASLNGIEQIKHDIQSAMATRISLQLGGFALAALLLAGAMFFLVVRVVLQPLRTLHLGLDHFFAFLQRRQDHIDPIALHGQDEFAEMACSLNTNIEVSAELHRSINALNESLERKVEERTRALSGANQKLELSLEGGRLGCFRWDISSNRNEVDARWAQMLDYQLEEIEKTFEGWQALLHPDDVAPTLQHVDACVSGETPYFEAQFRMRAKSGDYRWILARGKIIARDAEGRPYQLAGTHMDITPIKETEQRLSEATQRAEQALAELQATQIQLIQSEKMAALGHLIAGIAHEINTPLGAIRSSGGNITHSLDSVLAGLPELYPLLSAEEEVLFFDLLAQARREQPVLASREARQYARTQTKVLEQAGVERARQIADLLVQLGVRESPERYLPLIRHPRADFILDIAYSLATIVTNAANINHAVDRASKIVQALKSFARRDTSGARSDTDLRENIETVLTLYHNQIKQQVELVCHYDTVAPLLGYPDELCQVWTNLIHNALQAMEYRGTLSIELRGEAQRAVVTISDTGCGIAPEIRERVFEPFFTTKRAGEGTGLGLDLVAKIVAKHGGYIEFESQQGIGTSFRVYLPYPEPD